jgi:lipoprotein-anchoring transpeptidase ErfK/SrfK
VLVGLGASLGTATARQVWSQNEARARADTASAAAAAALAHARSAGLLSADLAPYERNLQQLRRAQVPSPVPPWSSAVATFYDNQAARYRNLERQIRAAVRRVTAAARHQAKRAIRRLRREIVAATSLDVDASAAKAALTRQKSALRAAKLPRQYRAVTEALVAPVAQLSAAVAAQQHVVSALLSQAGNSQSQVVSRATDEVNAAGGQLDQLGLLTSRVTAYRSTLQGELSAIQAAPSAFAAAVKEARLQVEIAAIQADYKKTVPEKMIVVSTEDQSATMYQSGQQVYSTPVTTGGPELPTDHGVFHIYLKLSPFVFHSPWPPGSPYYYPPTPITYWMPFDGGEGLHDAWWRSNFGPGSNLAPTDLGTGNYILGTHGCVNLPLDAAQFVWDWAPVGTTVVVV